MPVCKQCGATFTESDRIAGRCAHCGTDVEGRTTVPEIDPTATIAHLEPIVIPPPVRKLPTIDKIRIDQTIDLGSSDLAAAAEPVSEPFAPY